MSIYISSNAVDNPGVIYGCLHIYPVMVWTILGPSLVVYIYIQLCCGPSWGHLWLSTYIYSNAVVNPGVIYGCLHIYPVKLWTILGPSLVVYIYIQLCCGQSWVHLWLSTYISSNAVVNPGVIYGWLHMYPVMLWTILGSSMVVYIYIQLCCGQSWVIYGCLHIYPVMLWTILGSSMVVYIYIQ